MACAVVVVGIAWKVFHYVTCNIYYNAVYGTRPQKDLYYSHCDERTDSNLCASRIPYDRFLGSSADCKSLF